LPLFRGGRFAKRNRIAHEAGETWLVMVTRLGTIDLV
jgi:hypothetical protein